MSNKEEPEQGIFQAIVIDRINLIPINGLVKFGASARIALSHLMKSIEELPDNGFKELLLINMESKNVILLVTYIGILETEQVEGFEIALDNMDNPFDNPLENFFNGPMNDEFLKKFSDILPQQKKEWDGDELPPQATPDDFEEFLKFLKQNPPKEGQ